MSAYTLTPQPTTGELVLTAQCKRAAGLARALCRRVARPNGEPWRYYLTPASAARWQLLHDGGWSATRKGGGFQFVRNGRVSNLYNAIGATKCSRSSQS